jgi:hypothetical protein
MFKQVVAINHSFISRQTAVPPNNVEHRVTLTSVCLHFFKCYWLPSFPPTPRQMKQQVSCYMPAVAKRRLMHVTEQLGSASGRPVQFFCCRDRPLTGDWLQSVHRGRNTSPLCRPWGCAILLCATWGKWPWRLASMNWLCHLNAAFWKWNKWILREIL